MLIFFTLVYIVDATFYQFGLFEFHCIFDEIKTHMHTQSTNTRKKGAGFWYLFIRTIAFCFCYCCLNRNRNQNKDNKTLHRFHWSNTSCWWMWTNTKNAYGFFRFRWLVALNQHDHSFLVEKSDWIAKWNTWKISHLIMVLAADSTKSTKNKPNKTVSVRRMCWKHFSSRSHNAI